MNRVLLIESNPDIAELLAGILQGRGFEVVTVARLTDAISAARATDACFAMLEVNLGSSKSYLAAEVLATRDIPFAFISSQGTSGLDSAYRSRPVLLKPFNTRQVNEIVALLQVRPPRPSADNPS